jgi:hypothetical protein
MAGKFKLVINSGPDQGTEIPLEKAEISIGRDVKNDIVINDPEISRHHARLLLRTNTYVIEDTGSTNGTFINNQRLTSPMPLKAGELIFLGENVCLAFQSSYGDATVAVSSKRGGTKPGVPPPPPPVPSNKLPTTAELKSKPAEIVEPPIPLEIPTSAPKKKTSRWVWVIIITILVILLVCVVPLFIIDATNSWCSIFGDILHGINPAVCVP